MLSFVFVTRSATISAYQKSRNIFPYPLLPLLVRNPLLFAVFVLVAPCTKSREFRVKRVYTKITIYSLPCMSYILPFLFPPSPCPLVPPPPLDLKPLFYVDGLQTSSMAASAKIADNGRKWEDTTSYSDIIIRLYLWIALFPTSYGPARHISVWHQLFPDRTVKNQGQRSFFRILMGLALTARAERPLKERVSLEGSARKFWQFEINPGILVWGLPPGSSNFGLVSDQKWHFSHPFADLTSKKLFVNIRLRLNANRKIS